MPKPGIFLVDAPRLLCPLCSQGRRKGIGWSRLKSKSAQLSKANVPSLITTFRLQLGNSEKLQKAKRKPIRVDRKLFFDWFTKSYLTLGEQAPQAVSHE
jgi:hypothetical protein